MKFNYYITESLRGFKNAKLSTLASVFTIAISLILISIYFIIYVNSNLLIKSIKDKVEFELFLDESCTSEDLINIKEKIRTIGGIKNMTYISKDSAKKIFETEFGKDMLDILDENPLPASLKINLYDEYKSTERMEKIKSQLEQIPKVTDVEFKKEYLEVIEKNSSALLFVNLIVSLIITITSVFLVSNTIRLVISSRKKLIDLLKLLGAKRHFIITPFILEGFLQGFAGGILSLIILAGFYYYANSKYFNESPVTGFFGFEYVLYLILTGISLGVFGSIISLRKFFKKQKEVI